MDGDGSVRAAGSDVVALLVVAGPIPFDLFEHLVGAERVEGLERAAVVELGESPTALVSLGCGVGDGVELTASERIRLVRDVAAAVRSVGLGPAPPDVVAHVGSLLRDAGSFDADVSVRATRAALLEGSVELALELTAFGLDHDGANLELVHLRAMAFELAGRHGAATSVDARHAGVDDAAWLGRWASNLWQSTGRVVEIDPGDADDVNNEMRANLLWIEAFQGHVSTVASSVSTILDDPRSSTQAVVWACVAGAYPAALDGRPRIARRLVDHARSLVESESEQLTPFADLQVALVDVLCRLCSGDLAAARNEAERRRTEAADSSHLTAIWSLASGLAERELSNYSAAVDLFDTGLAVFEGDPFGLIPWAQSERNLCAAMAGKPEIPEGDAPASESHGLFHACLARNRAWRDAAAGDIDAAIEGIDEAIHISSALGQNVYLMHALVDLARFGEPRRAATMLTKLSEVGAEHLRVRTRIVTALASGNSMTLTTASASARRAGLALFADELLVRARDHAYRANDPSLAARIDLVVVPRGDPTPIFAEANPQAQHITSRERDVSLSAAAGRTSKEIGGQFAVSPRTVDNLLGRVYRKCDLAGRDELREWCRAHSTLPR